MNRFIDYLSGWSRREALLASSAVVVVLGAVDYVTGPAFSLFVLYIFPVLLASLAGGRGAGLALSLVSALSWALTHAVLPANYRGSFILAWDITSRFLAYYLFAAVVAALRSSAMRERESGRIDPLTGLANRRSFFELLDMELRRSGRYRHPLTLAYIDVDNFKEVNDRFGHEVGDKCLRTLAGVLRAELRASDVVARLGGDEFVLLLPEAGPHAAQAVLPKIRRRLQDAASAAGWPISFSIGAVTYLHPPPSAEDAVRHADTLMYGVKRGGKDRLSHQIACDEEWEERQIAARRKKRA